MAAWSSFEQRLFRAIHQIRSARVDDPEETCCPLPFFLQDLCLLAVINELDCFPTELLAALPKWLRYRILNNVPALDLARLEHTPVASGVNTDEIWKSRVNADSAGSTQTRQHSSLWCRSTIDGQLSVGKTKSPSPFQLNISRDRNLYSSSLSDHGSKSLTLTKDIISDLSDVKDSQLSIGSHRLLEMVSDLLTKSQSTGVDMIIRQLVSIPGTLIFSNLLIGSVHQDCKNPLCNLAVWKKQAVALVVKGFKQAYSRPYFGYRRITPSGHETPSGVHLIPRCLMPFYDKPDPVELFLLLTKDCQLHPHCVNIHIDTISQSFLPSLHTERFAIDAGSLSLPTEDAKYISVVNRFLENVVSLRLQCDKYCHVGLVVGMIEAAIANGQASKLKHLICALPDLYMDILHPLCALFLLPNFHLLSLDLSDMYPIMLSKLLQAFITTPCPHTHKLLIHIKGGIQFPSPLKENQVAAMDMQGLTIPSCSHQHKVLKFSSSDDLTKGLYLLLQFPAIRLKQLMLFTNEYLHLCAIHPDLQVTKLVITVVKSQNVRQHGQQPLMSTLQQDIVSLFKIGSLKKIHIRGTWGPVAEVKLGLVSGLWARSRLSPLKKLSLDLESPRSYKVRDFVLLCNALFSLPQLENLQLVLGSGFAEMMQRKCYEDVMHKSWRSKGNGIKLKSIFLHSYTTTDLKKVTLITQNLSYSSYPVTCKIYSSDCRDLGDDDDYYISAYSGYDYDDTWDYEPD